MPQIENVIHLERNDSLQERSYTLQFAADVPKRIVNTVLACWNEELREMLPGRAAFSFATAVDEASGQPRIIAKMFADGVAWKAYLNRGVSFAPRVNRRVEGLVATNDGLSRLFHGDAPRQVVHA